MFEPSLLHLGLSDLAKALKTVEVDGGTFEDRSGLATVLTSLDAERVVCLMIGHIEELER